MEKLHHVAITVPDIEKALDWYRAEFDVETTYADDSWALLQFENIALALVLPGQHPPHIAVERDKAELFGHSPRIAIERRRSTFRIPGAMRSRS
jgi:catechol 2,3-dioxygenase-like lactoylglutathione lyase family enzyme